MATKGSNIPDSVKMFIKYIVTNSNKKKNISLAEAIWKSYTKWHILGSLQGVAPQTLSNFVFNIY